MEAHIMEAHSISGVVRYIQVASQTEKVTSFLSMALISCEAGARFSSFTVLSN